MAAMTCYLPLRPDNHITKHRYCQLFWQWDGWFCPEAKLHLWCQTEQEQCMYQWHLGGKELWWNERKQLCICASCIHIDPRVMATSMWNCVARYRDGGVGEECFVPQLSLKHSQLETEREHVLTPVQGKIILYYRKIRHIFCRAATQDHTLGAEKWRFWSGESYFRNGGKGSRTRVSTAWTKHKETCYG